MTRVMALGLFSILIMQAQDNNRKGLYFNFDFTPNASLIGNNVPYGEKFSLYDRVKLSPPDVNVPVRTIIGSYGLTTTPLVAKMRNHHAYAGEVGYWLNNSWGLSLGASYFNTHGSDSGLVTSPPSDDSNYYVNGVGLFGHQNTPVYNQLEAKGTDPLSPVGYHGENGVSVMRGNAMLMRNLVSTGHQHLDLLVGVDATKLANYRSDGRTERAFLYYFYGLDHRDNHISVGQNGRADYSLMLGPSLGMQWQTKVWKGFTLEVKARQSFDFGNVRRSGEFIDVDDVNRVKGPIGGPFTTVYKSDYLYGSAPYSHNDSAVVPVTDMSIRLKKNVCKHMALGIGFTTAYMHNVPAAPTIDFPGAWELTGSTRWLSQNRNLMLSGMTASISYTR